MTPEQFRDSELTRIEVYVVSMDRSTPSSRHVPSIIHAPILITSAR